VPTGTFAALALIDSAASMPERTATVTDVLSLELT
jgi:hypothetical protein